MKIFSVLFLVFFLLISFSVFANINYNDLPKQVITIDGASLRDSSDFKTSKEIDTLEKGTIADVVEVFGDYYFIECTIKGQTVKGWAWQGRIDVGNSKITGSGVTLLKNPDAKKGSIGVVLPQTIKILDCKVTWVHIKNSDVDGWVWVELTKPIKK